MKNLLSGAALVAALGSAPAGSMGEETVTVPWQEFKRLFVADLQGRAQAVREPESLVSVERLTLDLVVTVAGASGRLLLRGRHVSGPVTAVAVSGSDLAIAAVDGMDGAVLRAGDQGVALIPQAGAAFALQARVAAALRPEGLRRVLDLRLPRSAATVVRLQLSEDLAVVSVSGVGDSDLERHLRPGEPLRLVLQRRSVAAQTRPRLDLLSVLEPDAAGVRVTTHVLAAEPFTAPIRMTLPGELLGVVEGFVQVERDPDGVLTVTPAAGGASGFVLRHRLANGRQNRDPIPASLPMQLPAVIDNVGVEGNVAVRSVPGTVVAVSGPELRTQLPAAGLGEALAERLGHVRSYLQAPRGALLAIAVRRLPPAPAPALVLDEVALGVLAAASGGLLYTLRMVLPADAPERLTVRAPPGARPWRLAVDGRSSQLFEDGDGGWVISRQPGRAQTVELAYLQPVAPLGMEGKLDLEVPGLPLAARRLRVGVQLGDRVRVLGVEGQLSAAAPPPGWQIPGLHGSGAQVAAAPNPASLAAEHHGLHLVREFYSGEALQAALYYREPDAEVAAR